MSYLSRPVLEAMGFKALGTNVLISDKANIYNADQIALGDNVRIDDFCVLSGKLSIGRNVHLAVFVNLAGGEEGVMMDDFSGLAYGCHVFTQSDDYSGRTMTNPTVPDEFKSETKARIVIGRHSIVGTSSIILPGVMLAEGTAVGAMTMVTKSTDPWSIYFGVPARKVKDRKKDLLELEARYLASENGALHA
ncbi:galactoside O-acetyltransferase [Dyella jiangningensis]|uniref:acyltransferase n=1 Tax=Dyella sp. AtDHG13 TaxID=1938897 RepID=UPI00088D0886|nr:acyltransferase [Dyella sp. AtDHG13]PXV61686.1 galactoside O-acetyltransferase [Dyella sp. AtDHG13]SDJ67258.1 galactoside O-acetyltransferase [Dyella jiangningensis]